MGSKLKNSNLIYRKLKISDYKQFKELFYLCVNRKISFDFFKWRYFSNKFSFCYGLFENSRLIANVGMVSIKLNNSNYERLFSRHSSMVLKEYRGNKVFSDLLKKVKNKILNKVRLVAMWPNKKNFSNFGIDKNKIIKKKYYLYQTSLSLKLPLLKKTQNFNINELIRLKDFIKNKNSLFYKNFIYFRNRYLSYKKKEYFINEFKFKNQRSFFILKRNKDKSGLNYVILDHFGSEKLKFKHLSYLTNNQNKLVFLSKKKINKPTIKFLNNLYFKIGFIKKFNSNYKKKFLSQKEIFLGDTDIFMTIGKN